MKKMMMMIAMMMTIAISANAMTYKEARYEAKVMTRQMDRELHLTSHQLKKVEKINLEYLTSANPRAAWSVRDRHLQNVLTVNQYRKYTMGSTAYYASIPKPMPKKGGKVVAKKAPAPTKNWHSHSHK